MSACDFPPTAQLHLLPPASDTPAPDPQLSADPADIGTIRNWTGEAGLPPEASLEPVALIDHLRASDPATAERLRAAIDRFPRVNSHFAGFDLAAVLGRGTFGRVYLARQGELADRFVALKVSADLAGESQTLARLQHTNIVPIYSVHREGPFQAVCMPFFGVATLAHLLHRFRGNTAVPATGRQLLDTLKGLSEETDIPALGSRAPGTGAGTGPKSLGSVAVAVDEAEAHLRAVRGPVRAGGPQEVLREITYPDAVCWIGARLADGLEHAHSHGILHNDLKPANVLLTDDGQPMLLDFGVSEDLKVRAVAPGAHIGGTLPYMAPEHLRSVRDRVPTTDGRSDVYALGIILFELLTGEHPFRVPMGKLEDEIPLMLTERSARPPRLRAKNSQVARGLEAIVRKCLEPDPTHRYQSAADLRDDLDRHRADLPLRFARVPVRERVRKWARRHPRLTSNVSLVTVAVVLLTLCIGGLVTARTRAERSDAAVAARQFDDDLKSAHYLLSTRAPEPATVERGIAKCTEALARYGLPEDVRWEQRAEFRALPTDEQQRVRSKIAEVCLLLARGQSLRSNSGAGTDEPLGAALRANELAETVTGSATKALWEQRAELMRRLGRSEGAAQSAEKAKDAPLATAGDYYLSGTEAMTNGKHRDALPLLRKAVELDPGDFSAHMSLGRCYENLGRYSDASACYTTAIALRPDHSGGYYARALVALRTHDPARAKDDLDKVAELLPDTADVFLNRALANQELKNYPAGLRDLEYATELGAPQVRALCMRAQIKHVSGDPTGAAKDLAEAMKLNAEDDVGLVARGIVRLNTDLAGAISDFDAALVANPRSIPAQQNKAHAQGKMGKDREAIRTLDRLLEMYPDYVPARSGRGVLHARLGNAKEAIVDATDVLKREPSPVNAYQAACVYALLDKVQPGARTEAIRLLTAALRRGFGHEHVDTDKDLNPIRDTPEFKRIVESARTLRTDVGRQ
ncbi:Serine/threonine-protein kinase PknB [Gemmata sp. SH-PL17]|uniref:serine/threonine-protein kinase n=1 Tax=Gemmata sp. SH-PL17 TaxID=1630693 RepID=UPI00078BCC19|nr:serine/threonine-protein kinase [Gemmata sp. SH-PL17]AMV26908.1 Serine/threonine-protein kinase PknB [Gemmata sp. SH-PL17]